MKKFTLQFDNDGVLSMPCNLRINQNGYVESIDTYGNIQLPYFSDFICYQFTIMDEQEHCSVPIKFDEGILIKHFDDFEFSYVFDTPIHWTSFSTSDSDGLITIDTDDGSYQYIVEQINIQQR